MSAALQVLDWAPHPRVVAAQTWRGDGGDWGFNLGDHVGAPAAAVIAARAALLAALPGAESIHWLRQVHGTGVVEARRGTAEGDALWSTRPGAVCAVLTADCLPLLLADSEGVAVAAVHAGWRGLAAGVIEAAVAALPVPAGRLQAWLGPRIGPTAFEVGGEVREALVQQPEDAAAFRASDRPGHWRADLGLLARRRLAALGIQSVTDMAACTVSDPARWYSYRREGRCGRMASLIWLQPHAVAQS